MFLRHSVGWAATLVMTLASIWTPQLQAGSRILATGGVSSIGGAAGGGLIPWAVMAGTASEGEFGAIANFSHAEVNDFSLQIKGVAFDWSNRLELSYARQDFYLDSLGGRLKQDIYGAKVRLFGDLIYAPWGQWSLGLQRKENLSFALPQAVGAKAARGTDYYLSGSKLLLAGAFGYNLLLNGNVRATRANQDGLLGFGGDREDRYRYEFEAAAAVLLNSNWAVGTEYRQKPNNLSFAREDDWKDAFVAYFPCKSLSVTAAYLDLGDIAGFRNQTGYYLSLQGAF